VRCGGSPGAVGRAPGAGGAGPRVGSAPRSPGRALPLSPGRPAAPPRHAPPHPSNQTRADIDIAAAIDDDIDVAPAIDDNIDIAPAIDDDIDVAPAIDDNAGGQLERSAERRYTRDMIIFDNVDIFNGGPGHLIIGQQGRLTVPALRLQQQSGAMIDLGPLDLIIIAHGLFIGDQSIDVWSGYDAVLAMITDPPPKALLINDDGREWPDMTMMSMITEQPVMTGRKRTLAAQITFIRISS